jgi:ankyrin repeat protein
MHCLWLQMIEFLLNKGANKYATNSNGQMPSEMAELLSDENMRRQTIAALN